MSKNSKQKVINLSLYEYIHIRDINESLVKVVQGPQTYIVQENEEIVGAVPQNMIVIPPMHYICIKNPVICKEDGTPELEKHGQPKLAFAETQYRFQSQYKTPFFLYFGEEVLGKLEKLLFVKTNTALTLTALRTFQEGEITRQNGDSWLFIGPKFYYPRPDRRIVNTIDAIIIKSCSALRLKANQNFKDDCGIVHKAGEEWLVREPGAYIKGVYETVVRLQNPVLINDRQAIHLRALKAFKDVYGNDHKAGEEWILTPNVTSWHIIDIFEEQVAILNMIVLTKDQFAVILNPIGNDGKNQKGSKKLMQGEKSFFLQPGEELEKGIENIMILNENEAVLLQAKESFKDSLYNEDRIPGDKWMVKGPCRFLPPIEVEIVEKRSVIPLDDKEGIYVRDTKKGTVRAQIGKSYLLEANEELWANELTEVEEEILENANPEGGKRDKTRVVSYKCPYNAVMQIFNYKIEKSRIVFGPELVLLDPDEKFCVMYLSGKTPKIPGIIKTLNLNMGPTYTTDRIEVETSDHALLVIEVAYNWFFDVDKKNQEECTKIFAVRDCIGEMCSLMAGRVRGAVAEMTLNDFHKNSAKVIRKAVMGSTNEGKINDKYLFTNNLLAISNVDIKNIDTKNKDIKDKLQKTVNLAIESTTQAHQEEAKRDAESKDQEAKSFLQRKIIEDNSKSMEFQKILYEKKTITKSMEEQGPKEAQAKAEASKMFIESSSKINIAKNNKELQKIKNSFKNEIEKLEHELKMEHEKGINESEIAKKKLISEIETQKFNKIIEAIGKETLVEISQAGPESQVKLLESLGLNGFIMTDGNSPINLFNFANNIAKK